MNEKGQRKIQRFGAHMSIAGVLENAIHAGVAAGCDCLQIFVKNQRQWVGPSLTREAVTNFRRAAGESNLWPMVAHATYLINLASPRADLHQQSIEALADEFRRCDRLGVDYLVVHPGAHMGEGVDSGIARIVVALNKIHRQMKTGTTKILLETTAGQGSSIGGEIEHLGKIMNGVRPADRMGVCVDTCHVFAAGYDISDSSGYRTFRDKLDRHVGLENVKCIHVNDSKGGCGSHLDRHEHISKGCIGKAGFVHILNDAALANAPRILETPKGMDGRGTDLDRVNLKRLRSYVEPS